MAKSVVLGNGQMAVGLDKFGQVYDLHFPYVGLENHTRGNFAHKIGVWTENQFSWIDDGNWEIIFNCLNENSHDNKFTAVNSRLGIELHFDDAVYNEKNILLRNITVRNLKEHKREIRLFFNHQFEIYESSRGDTAFYDPDRNAIVHYKGRRIFLINAWKGEKQEGFDQYSIGLNGIEGKEGTYKDAEDGNLEMNPIEHGLVDSVIRLNLDVEGKSTQKIWYWMCVSKLMSELHELNDYVTQKTPDYLINSTKDYWAAWVRRINRNFADLSPQAKSLFEHSLHTIRVHSDNTGGIIASSDSHLLKYGRDGYSYVWPRDGALTSVALSRAGYSDVAERFFRFCNSVITEEGYFMHKYRPDQSLGSSWHPWVYEGEKELPIQIDETALVVYAIWENYRSSRDVEFIEEIYNSLVKKATEFLISRIDKKTGIVEPSYDLWEEKFGSSTFTSSSVYAALISASKLAEVFGKEDKAKEYAEHALLVLNGVLNHHYDSAKRLFYKRINTAKELKDESIDTSALYGLYKFGLLESHDERIMHMRKQVSEKVACNCGIGGVARHEDDPYFRVDDSIAGNPWIITTLWIAQLDIANAKTIEDLENCKSYIEWALEYTSASGVLSEQLNPHTGEPISATPLTWSHAEYVVTVLDYIEKYNAINRVEEALELYAE